MESATASSERGSNLPGAGVTAAPTGESAFSQHLREVQTSAEHGLELMVEYVTEQEKGLVGDLSFDAWRVRRLHGTNAGNVAFRQVAKRADWRPVAEVQACNRDERDATRGKGLQSDVQAFAQAYETCRSAFLAGRKLEDLFMCIVICCQRGRTVFMQWDCDVCITSNRTDREPEMLRTFGDCQKLLREILDTKPPVLSTLQADDAEHYLRNMQRRQHLCGVLLHQGGFSEYVRQRDAWLQESLKATKV